MAVALAGERASGRASERAAGGLSIRVDNMASFFRHMLNFYNQREYSIWCCRIKYD